MHSEDISDIDEAFEIALQHHQSGHLSEAESLYLKIIQADPNHLGAMYLLAGMEYEIGRYQAAFDLASKVIAEEPNDPDALHLLGLSSYKLGKHKQAIDFIGRAVALNPEYSQAHYSLGEVQQADAQLDAAITSYRRALSLNPQLVDAHCNLGAALVQQGNLNEAGNCYLAALSLYPHHFNARINLGSIFGRQGKPEEAIKHYREALALQPDHADTHSNLGIALYDLGRLEEATACYQKALALMPQHVDAQCNLGCIFLQQGRLDDAIDCFHKALSLRFDHSYTHENLGMALYNQRKFDEAVAEFQKAIEFDSNNTSARHLLASLSGEDTESAPQDYVKKLFDGYANSFDQHLVGTLNYKTPQRVRVAVDQLTNHTGKFRRALDLGCGTGLAGESFQDIVESIDGVDLSPKMLEQAMRKAIYNNLHACDVLEFLDRAASDRAAYDIVLSADVFVYIGNLAPIFAAVRRVLVDGGLFGFSVEDLPQGSYKLLASGRYAHSVSHIRELAATNGFSVELFEQLELRKEGNAVITGDIFILK